MIIVLLECGIEVGDSLLHAISEEYVEAVEELLQWEETHHKDGQPYVSIERSAAEIVVTLVAISSEYACMCM